MKIITAMKAFFSAALIALALPAGASAYQVGPGGYSTTLFLNSEDLTWESAPASLPAGAKMSVLLGDPSQPGPFVIRFATSGEYVVPPHFHSRAEAITVISGTLFLGGGTEFEPPAAHTLRAGDFHYLPAKAPHFAFTKTPTVVEIHGEGPFDIIYLNPADDPRNKP